MIDIRNQKFLAGLNVVLLCLFTLLVFTILVKLGFWQLDRSEQKTARLQKIATFSEMAAVDLQSLARHKKFSANNFSFSNDIPVELSGSFRHNSQFLLDNQIDNGQFGHRVFQIFEDDSGFSVLVSLGWIKGDKTRQTQPTVERITGRHNMRGMINLPELPMLLDQESFAERLNNQGLIRIQQIDLEKISQLSGEKLLPFVIYLDKKETLGFKKSWQPVVMSPQKHKGYAVQWFSLAAAWLVLMAIFAWRSLLKKKTQNPFYY